MSGERPEETSAPEQGTGGTEHAAKKNGWWKLSEKEKRALSATFTAATIVAAIATFVAFYAHGGTTIIAVAVGIVVVLTVIVTGVSRIAALRVRVPLLLLIGTSLAAAAAGGGIAYSVRPGGQPVALPGPAPTQSRPAGSTATASPAAARPSSSITAAPPASSPTASGTTPVNSYTPGQRTVLLDDPMTASTGQWTNQSTGTGTCDIERDGLHAKANDQNQYHECYSRTSVTNFTFEVSFRFGSATGAGIFFRMAGPGSWYNAQWSKNGIALISKGVAGTSTNLNSAQLARPDLNVTHVLAVVAIGNKITLYADHKQAVSVTDDSFRSGDVGVYTVGEQPGGETVFRNAVVWGP